MRYPSPKTENAPLPPNLGTLRLPEDIKSPEYLVIHITHPLE